MFDDDEEDVQAWHNALEYSENVDVFAILIGCPILLVMLQWTLLLDAVLCDTNIKWQMYAVH